MCSPGSTTKIEHRLISYRADLVSINHDSVTTQVVPVGVPPLPEHPEASLLARTTSAQARRPVTTESGETTALGSVLEQSAVRTTERAAYRRIGRSKLLTG